MTQADIRRKKQFERDAELAIDPGTTRRVTRRGTRKNDADKLRNAAVQFRDSNS